MKNFIYKKQSFQQKAVDAICDVFEGEIGGFSKFISGIETNISLKDFTDGDKRIYGYKNDPIFLTNELLLKNIQNIQKRNYLYDDEISKKIDKNDLNLTVEMETGTGKTYVYINTIFELNKRYNWSKFVIVVPSIAIREGVYSSFEDTAEHFKSEYGKPINFFVYNPESPSEVFNFNSDDGIYVIIINSQAFNSDNNKIYSINDKLPGGVAPIEYIKSTNPIVIIDEPQTVEGKSEDNKTKMKIKEFNPLFKLRYSATHRFAYDMVYRFDAVDAFNEKKVKKIEINGIEIKGSTATHGYFYPLEIIISKKDPLVRIEIEKPNKNKKVHLMSENDNIYEKYSNLQQYKGWIIDKIDYHNSRVIVRTDEGDKTFIINQIHGVSESDLNHLRKAQIRATIRAHLNKELINYKNNIKTLSLFFIDRVDKYRKYDEYNNPLYGEYAEMFCEIYHDEVSFFLEKNPEMKLYLGGIDVDKIHNGYFSIDKKTKKMKDPELSGRGKEKVCNDVDAFDLIMKGKKELLNLKNPVRFIFSHSALKEGWDNPNVFQICILRDKDSTMIKKRQEVGRGLRLCVNNNFERIDSDDMYDDINILTVIANESYETFAKELQEQFMENLKNRPLTLTTDFLITQKINGVNISSELANKIVTYFASQDYIDLDGKFTDKYKNDFKNNSVLLHDSLKSYSDVILKISKGIIDNSLNLSDARKNILTAKLNEKNFNHPEFKKLWENINFKSYYTVDFNTKELISKSIDKIDKELKVSNVCIESIKGMMKEIKNRNFEFEKTNFSDPKEFESFISKTIKFDLISEIVNETRLTRNTIVSILSGINVAKFKLFKQNPVDFIKNVSKIINEVKSEIVLDNIKYHKTDDVLDNIFEKTIKVNYKSYIETPNRHIYDLLEYDSDNYEKPIGVNADIFDDLIVFAKIPRNKFNIETPVGNFGPDWLMVFKKEKIKHAYCIFESKSTLSEDKRRGFENTKIKCARKHFEAISGDKIKFEAVTSFDEILREIK